MVILKNYDSSWDLDGNEEQFNKKFIEWEKRSWEKWLNDNLNYPFQVERVEDDDDVYFLDTAKKEPFRLGHVMKAVSIDMEDDTYGIILKVREGKRVGAVPLCEVEVTLKDSDNYWPIREYAVWFANREWF